MRTVDAARDKWADILVFLGLEREFLRNRHGPCPLCGGRDRFRFDNKRGDGTWFCNQCGSGAGIDLVMHLKGFDFKTAAAEVDRIVGNVELKSEPEKPKADPIIRLRKISNGFADMGSINPVRRYLHRRGLTPTHAIKYHPGLEHYDSTQGKLILPAMACVFTSVDGRPLSLHITALTQNGQKANVESPKKIMPPIESLNGSAIRLFPVTPHIGIAEGIETALAVHRDYGIPCWAAANAGLLEKFDVPEGIKSVSIFGDNDSNFTGQKAAFTLANRIYRKVSVDVFIPSVVDSDFADKTAGQA